MATYEKNQSKLQRLLNKFNNAEKKIRGGNFFGIKRKGNIQESNYTYDNNTLPHTQPIKSILKNGKDMNHQGKRKANKVRFSDDTITDNDFYKSFKIQRNRPKIEDTTYQDYKIKLDRPSMQQKIMAYKKTDDKDNIEIKRKIQDVDPRMKRKMENATSEYEIEQKVQNAKPRMKRKMENATSEYKQKNGNKKSKDKPMTEINTPVPPILSNKVETSMLKSGKQKTIM